MLPPPRHAVSWMPLMAAVAVIVVLGVPVQGRWCTRIVPFTAVRTYVEQSMCNYTYTEPCGYFTFSECEKTGVKECLVSRNRTQLKYKIVETCCPGYKLNPINNLTCMSEQSSTTDRNGEVEAVTQGSSVGVAPLATDPRPVTTNLRPVSAADNLPREDNSYIESTATEQTGSESGSNEDSETQTVAGVVEVAGEEEDQQEIEQKSKTKALGDEVHDGSVRYYNSNKRGSILGLTNGAYAGIACLALFLACALILMSVRIHKRRRKANLKAPTTELQEMETTQKMIPDSHA